MKFLRLALNALICGLYFSLLLALLVLDLNINHRLRFFDLPRLALFLLASYGLVAALVCLAAAGVYRFFAGRARDAKLISLPFLTLGFSLLTFLFLVIFRENTAHFAPFFVPGARAALRGQLIAWFAAAASGLILFYRHNLRRRPGYLGVFFVLAGAAYLYAAVVRSNYPEREKPYGLAMIEPKRIDRRVTILEFEGLSFDFLVPLVNERKLPNFAYLMENGAWGHLLGFTPSDPYVLRRTVETGKLPGKHRRLSDIRYEIPGFEGRIEVVPRFILFRQLTRIGLLKIVPNEAPSEAKDIWEIFAAYGAPVLRFDGAGPAAPDPAANSETEKRFEAAFADLRDDASALGSRLRAAFLHDLAAEERGFAARIQAPPQLFGLTLDGLDEVQTYFTKYSLPELFGDIRTEAIQKYGAVIERYYQFYDRILSKYLAALKDEEMLIVYSSFGFEPLPFWKRLVEWALGNADVSAYHERGPDGAVFLYGSSGIVRGTNLEPLRLVDVAPTLLYYAGLPVAKSMDGFVRAAAFTKEFKESNPIQTISAYEDAVMRKNP
jgi:hypothetical protein